MSGAEGTGLTRLLILDDDVAFANTLARSFAKRGYAVHVVHSGEELGGLADTARFDAAVVDLNLGKSSGLRCVELLHARDPATRIVVLTGYASIATAVEAIKLGAANYLPKPASTDEIEAAFGMRGGHADALVPARRTSIKRLEWERIQQMLAEVDFNVSEAARRLGMHRRTLARKLAKRPPA
ncbi:response regulator transcription factor [Qipengyuania sediminis]|uniref:response regulator transcription factor n=1 Tax=Qipengyuania sediminis TaxID=1532023 RepID=UPI00105941E2|nr:response regulator transcription factor [Qipengyuania sediminis]